MKKRTTDRIFGEIYLKTIRYIVCNQEGVGRDMKEMERTQFLGGGYIKHKGEVQNFGH